MLLLACMGTLLGLPNAAAAKHPLRRGRKASARTHTHLSPVEAVSAEKLALLNALAGKWAGVLEYQDYDEAAVSTSRIRLPTWLAVSTDRQGAAIFAYTYDERASKIMTDSQLVHFDLRAGTMIIAAENKNEKDVDSVRGYGELKEGRGVLVATGPRTEDGKVIETRTTWLIQRNLLEWTLETRRSGEGYSFRHEYVFTRNLPPPATGEAALSSLK